MIDPRIIRLGIEIDGAVKYYEDLYISAKGMKFTSPNQGQCNITILNINRETREFLMREANPFNGDGKRKSVILEVGRESYGTSVLYIGDIFRVQPTSKPDLGLQLRCITGHFNKGKLLSRSGAELSKLSTIAMGVATDNELALSFEVPDRNIANYTFTGSATAQITKLGRLSESDVYVDNGTLFIKPTAKPKKGGEIRVLNKKTGMIGTPKGTETGVKTKILFDPVTQIGGQIDLTSEVNPVLDGSYVVYKLDFDITNRDGPFYLNVEANILR